MTTGKTYRRYYALDPCWAGRAARGSRRIGGRRSWIARSFLGGFILLALTSMPLAPARASQFVKFDFNLTLQARSRDTVFLEVFDDRPITRDNFMQYVNGGHFDGMLMHRLARNFVLQGGGYYPQFQAEPPPVNTSLNPNAKVDLDGNPATSNPTILNEFSNSPPRSNVRGTLAMAKMAGNPDSATSEFFFNIANNGGTSPNGLDFQNGGFTVFAQVVGDGMTYIDQLNGLQITNLNPDTNDDGVRESNFPFYRNSTDGVPFIGSTLVVVQDAQRIDYLGAGSTTNVPVTGYGVVDRDLFIDTGAAFTGTGHLEVGAGRKLGVREGLSLNRPLVNFGSVAPGLQLGTITVGSFAQRSGGTLEIDLRQTTVDTEYDRLTVTGSAMLDGKLKISLFNGFLPQPGNTFTVLTAVGISGDFSAVELPQLTAGFVWNFNKSATAVSLAVAAADYNKNGVVDAADYTVWRNALGTTVAAYAPGDGNGDTQVDAADFLIWKNNFANIRGGILGSGAAIDPSATVPEPNSVIAIAMVASVFWLRTARRRLNRQTRG